MSPASVIIHRHQEKPYSCGAAAIAMLFGQPESIIRKEIKTDSNGTHDFEIVAFLKREGIPCHLVTIDKAYSECIDNLIKLSYQFPIYCGANYRDRIFTKGRDRKRCHASLICDGLIYDPAENREMTGEAYERVFNKSLVFNSLIVIEIERDNFLRNFRENS